MAKRWFVVILLAAVVAGLYFGVLRNADSPADVVNPSNRTTDPEILKLFEARNLNVYADSYGVAHLSGTIENNSDTLCKEAKVEVKIYTKENDLLKKLQLTVRDIPSGRVRTFDAELGNFTSGLRPEAEIVEVVY